MEKQKIRLLKLLEILKKYSDEDHPLSTTELIAHLQKEKICIERKTLYDDIKLLNASGYEVLCEKGKSNRYFVEDREFELPELKILLDAVQSARFITEKKSKVLTEKIAAHAGQCKAELLTRNVVWLNTTKRKNESIYYNIDALVNAILSEKQASFQYFDYDIRKQRVYRKNGERYCLTPVRLIYTNDNYYLIGFSHKYDDFANYRIDRMDSVAVEECEAVNNDKIAKFDFYSYKKKIFAMFSGDEKRVELIVHNSLIDVILDRFGDQITFTYYNEDNFRIFVDVEVSQTFFAWIFTFRDKIKIQSPVEVVSQIKSYIYELSQIY